MTTAIPYNLKPKATRLPEGPDDSLDPAVPPTDAERRGIPPIFWAAMDKSKGPAGPPDAPLAPPPTDSAQRSVPLLVWPKVPAAWVPNRPIREGTTPITLDPDIALWPVIPVNIWPFQGAPTEGIWPKGWMGVDNTAQPYVCTEAGEPGTWAPIGFSSAGVASFNTRTGAVVLELADLEALAYVPTPAASGLVLASTGNAQGDWAWEATPDLSPQSGTLASPYSLTNAFSTYMTTPSLAVGTWQLTQSAYVVAASDACTFKVVEGTATAAITGCVAAQVPSGSVAQVTLTVEVVVTVAGTIEFQGISPSADGTVESSTNNPVVAGCTGWTAVKTA